MFKASMKTMQSRRRSKADMWWLYSEIQSCFKQKIVLLQRFTNSAQLRIYRSIGWLQEFTRIPFFAAKITCYVQLEQDWISAFVVSVRWGLILLQEPPVWMNRERIEMGRILFCKLFVSMLGGWGRIRWRKSCSRCSKRAWKRCKAGAVARQTCGDFTQKFSHVLNKRLFCCRGSQILHSCAFIGA